MHARISAVLFCRDQATRNVVKLYVGITDYDWFKLHSSKAIVKEVNFWKPSSQLGFRVLQWGEPFLFKLHAPRNFIVGGGFFTKFLRLPVSLAWETFGEANGAQSLAEVRIRIAKYRKKPIGPAEDPVIGCILLGEPFFFAEQDWIPIPSDFKTGIQMGKSYDMEAGTGLMLWREVTERLEKANVRNVGPAEAAQESARYGTPRLVAPRLGPRIFSFTGDGRLSISLRNNIRKNASSLAGRSYPPILGGWKTRIIQRSTATK